VSIGPIFVSSGDLVADRRYQWAVDYLARGDRTGAADILAQVVEIAPAFASAWFMLAEIREEQGDLERAVAAFRAARDADPADTHGAGLHLARLGVGEATPAMTAAYVRRLFDQYAPRFDQSLLEHLDYRAPQLLLEAVAAVARAQGRSSRFKTMLDLGCGTGLAGVAFRAVVDQLAGVDIAAAMIAQARRRAIYDRLDTGELMEFLAAEAAAESAYDLIVAADVLVYLHDLTEVAAAVRRVLAPSGLFAFTVEAHPGDSVIQRSTLRYAHGVAHVRGAMAGAGLALKQLADVATRTEKREPVAGLLGIATAT
jgi:predicted TPR repeat methyltransferase